MDVLSRCACGGAPALYAPDVKSETKYAASVVCHHCGVSMQMANHDSDPKRVVAAWNRAHPHRINTMTVNEKGLEAAREAIIGNPLSDDQLSRIIKAYLRAASKDAEPMAWIAEAGENKQPCLCWTEAVALSEADGDRSRITPLFTHPSTGVEGGVRVKGREALIEAVADELVAHGEFSSMPGRNHANASKAAKAILPIILTAIEPVAASPGVGEPKLTAYETQVLIGTSISGCNMPPDRVFDLKVAWARLYELGLIDRTDGLAIATPAGASRINAMLAAAPTSPAPSPAGGDVLLADRLLGPVTEAALRLIAGAFRRDGEELGSERRPRFSIPTRPDHDDDCVVIDALKEAARALSSKQRSGE